MFQGLDLMKLTNIPWIKKILPIGLAQMSVVILESETQKTIQVLQIMIFKIKEKDHIFRKFLNFVKFNFQM
jgi:hypothetical protein